MAGAGLASVGGAAADSAGHSLPGADGSFRRRSPEAVGMDGDRVRKAVDFLTTRNARSVRVYRRNCLIATSRLDAATGDVPVEVFSASKSIASMVTGRAATLGHLALEDPVGAYIPELPGVDEAHRALTFRQLLTQTSGLHNSGAEVLGIASAGPADEARYALEVPFDHQPGEYFDYAQYPLTLLTYAVEHAVGDAGVPLDFQAFAQDELFGPVGIDAADWYWTRDRAGNTHGWAGAQMAPTDLARLGHLMANDGKWNGERLLSGDYVDEARSGTDENPGYGLLFWTNGGEHLITPRFVAERTTIEGPRPLVRTAPADLYAFWGAFGQLVFVIPSLELVVVRTGVAGNLGIDNRNAAAMPWGDQFHRFFRLLMDAVEDTDPGVPEVGPYEYDTRPTAFDFRYWFSPEATATSYGLDDDPTAGCTPLGCDGDVAVEGVVQNGEGAITTSLHRLTEGP